MERVPSPLFDTLEALDVLADFDMLACQADLPASLIRADAALDYQHALHFLYAYRGSAETFKSYRREVERLVQWAWIVEGKSIKDLRRMEIENFIEFCQAPPQSWITSKHFPRFIDQGGARVPNTAWRPFVAVDPNKPHVLSQSALQAIFAILSSFYNYLEQEEYVTQNPIAQIRQKSKFLRKQQTQKQVRRLSEMQWVYTLETAEMMAVENPGLHERTLFIMNALFGMYLRISELAASARWIPEMGHFFKDADQNWWFKTVGKGNKERDISVSNAMLAALKRYRASLGLTALPSPGESYPLIPKASGLGPIEGTRHIRKIVQACFDKTMERLRADGFVDEADGLIAATVHWLRHTGISEDVKTRPREHVRDDAGHSSSAITDRYIDIELRARHASAKKKLIKL